MFDEFLTSVKAQLYDRVASPLLGSFVISWIVWNFPLLLIIFSGEPIRYQLRLIETIVYAPYVAVWFGQDIPGIVNRGLLYPLGTAIAFLFLYPFPARLAFHWWRRQQKVLRDIRQKIEGDELLSIDESRDIRQLVYRERRRMGQEISAKDTEIATLNRELEQLRKKQAITEHASEQQTTDADSNSDSHQSDDEVNPLLPQHSPDMSPTAEELLSEIEKLSSHEHRILLAFNPPGDIFTFEELRRAHPSIPYAKFYHYLEKLENEGWISKKHSGSDLVYFLTDRSRLVFAEPMGN